MLPLTVYKGGQADLAYWDIWSAAHNYVKQEYYTVVKNVSLLELNQAPVPPGSID